ncbi:MAG: hypothetical protein L0H29_11740 [Sinobacteraceae bacterium]|nr:hypothetical protein [Nevskiaceae bacterium]
MKSLRITPSPTSPQRLRAALAFLFVASGLGMCMWYGDSWLNLPDYSTAQIEQTAQLNVMYSMYNAPSPKALTPEQVRQRVDHERQRVVAAIHEQRTHVVTGLVAGLVLMVLGVAQYLLRRTLRRN